MIIHLSMRNARPVEDNDTESWHALTKIDAGWRWEDSQRTLLAELIEFYLKGDKADRNFSLVFCVFPLLINYILKLLPNNTVVENNPRSHNSFTPSNLNKIHMHTRSVPQLSTQSSQWSRQLMLSLPALLAHQQRSYPISSSQGSPSQTEYRGGRWSMKEHIRKRLLHISVHKLHARKIIPMIYHCVN